jgi:hypothetical protein
MRFKEAKFIIFQNNLVEPPPALLRCTLMLVSHPTRNYLTRIEKSIRVQRSSLFRKRFRLHRKKSFVLSATKS